MGDGVPRACKVPVTNEQWYSVRLQGTGGFIYLTAPGALVEPKTVQQKRSDDATNGRHRGNERLRPTVLSVVCVLEAQGSLSYGG